jgi:hypothetical protein
LVQDTVKEKFLEKRDPEKGDTHANLHISFHISLNILAAKLDEAVIQDLIEKLLIILSDLYFLFVNQFFLLLLFG